jgi:hypothetical protein
MYIHTTAWRRILQKLVVALIVKECPCFVEDEGLTELHMEDASNRFLQDVSHIPDDHSLFCNIFSAKLLNRTQL